MLNHILHSNQQVVTHPVEHLTADDIASLPELPMTQSADGAWYCDGESTQDGTPSQDNPIPITNTYPAGTYKAICGDKVYKVVLDDDLRSVPGTADRVVIDAGRGVMWVERKVNSAEFDGSDDENWWQYIDSSGFIISIDSMVIGNRSNAYCSHFTNSNGEISGVYEQGFWSGVGNNRFYIIEVSELATTVDEWKSWLSSNPVTVHYILATPTTHQSIPTQLLTIQSGRSAQLLNTVNDKADFLAVGGDSWQLVQDEIVDEYGNVIQPKMPSPEYQSKIKDVGGTLRSCGWNLFDIEKAKDISNWIPSTVQRGYSDFPVYVGKGNTFTVSYKDVLETGLGFYAGVVLIENSGIHKWLYHSRNSALITNVFTHNALEDYIYIRCHVNTIDRFFNYCTNLQVNISDTKKPYDRHRDNSITLPTLRGLPDGTRDVLYVDRKAKRAWVERKVGHEILDGITGGYRIYSVYSVRDNVVRFGVYTNNKYLSISNKKMLCNYLRDYAKGASSWLSDEENIFWHISQSSAGFYFSLSKTLLSQYGYDGETKDSAITAGNAWLQAVYEKGEPFEILFELAEPVIEELPYSDYLLEMCQYETNISFVDCNENLVPEIEVGCKILGR